jgi:uncharacterized protein YjiS (DUF1127 family)
MFTWKGSIYRGAYQLSATDLLIRAISGAGEALLTWQERARQRRALADLDDRMLDDIGLRRADVAQEAMKPFWRP